MRTPRAKVNFYRRIRTALRAQGRFVTVDCHPAKDNALAREQQQAWTEHLRKSYSKTQAAKLLAAWAHEDSYMPLESEIELMKKAGFEVEVLWRKESFAVLMAK